MLIYVVMWPFSRKPYQHAPIMMERVHTIF